YYALLLSHLAGMYKEKRDYPKAEATYKETLERSSVEDGKDSTLYADFLDDLAELYISQKAFDRAEPLYQEALKIREKEKRDRDYAGGLSHLGELYKQW